MDDLTMTISVAALATTDSNAQVRSHSVAGPQRMAAVYDELDRIAAGCPFLTSETISDASAPDGCHIRRYVFLGSAGGGEYLYALIEQRGELRFGRSVARRDSLRKGRPSGGIVS